MSAGMNLGLVAASHLERTAPVRGLQDSGGEGGCCRAGYRVTEHGATDNDFVSRICVRSAMRSFLRPLLRALLLALLCLTGLGALPASAQTVDEPLTLRFTHFWPGVAGIHKNVFRAWADTVEKASGGRLRVEIFPSETLSKADNAYQATVDGIADIAATAPGYTNGRFPLTQVVELPNVSTSATQGACIAQTLYDEGVTRDEYADSHVLFFFTTGPGYLHGRQPIRTPDDLRGMRVRRPTAVVGQALKELGAMPVGMPAPEVYTALQRGVIDAVSLPWEGTKVFRLNEQARWHTEVPFYTLAFVATMNRDVYENLPPDLQKVIDDNSGMRWSLRAAAVFDKLDQLGRQEAVEAGHHIVTIDRPYEDPRWAGPLNATVEAYLEQLDARGLAGRAALDAALTARDRCPGAESASAPDSADKRAGDETDDMEGK